MTDYNEYKNYYTNTYTGGWGASTFTTSTTYEYTDTYRYSEPLFRYAEPPIRMVNENFSYGINPLWEFTPPVKEKVIDDWWDIWGEMLYD